VPYKYYVSDANGKTYYAQTLSEHEKNIAKARDAG
jgi:cell division protein YceG involved in septum cleavage